MDRDFSNRVSHRLIILAILGLAFVGIYTTYVTQSNTFNSIQPVSTILPLTNPEVLGVWLPESAYNYTLSRVNDYLNANNLTIDSATIENGVDTSTGSYTFNLMIQPQAQTLPVAVTISNFNGIISTAVTIAGHLQTPQIAATSDSATINGIDELVDRGITTAQVNDLRLALQKFNSGSATFDTANIRHSIDQTTGINTYVMNVTISNKVLSAKIICPGINSLELILVDSNTQKQVYDSRVIDTTQ